LPLIHLRLGLPKALRLRELGRPWNDRWLRRDVPGLNVNRALHRRLSKLGLATDSLGLHRHGLRLRQDADRGKHLIGPLRMHRHRR
jgi:hypothetical protein